MQPASMQNLNSGPFLSHEDKAEILKDFQIIRDKYQTKDLGLSTTLLGVKAARLNQANEIIKQHRHLIPQEENKLSSKEIATAHKVEVNEGLLDIDKPETIVETTQKIFTPQLYEQLQEIEYKVYKDSTLQDFVYSFATDCTKIPKENLEVKRVEPGLTSGATGTPVFLVTNKENKQLVCVVKANPPGIAQKEIDALKLLNSLPMTQAQFPHILGIAKHNGDTLVAQSPAPGTPLANYMIEVGKTIGKERSNQFSKLQTGMQTAAKGLADLHNQKPISSVPPSPEAKQAKIRSYKQNMEQYLTEMQSKTILDSATIKHLNHHLQKKSFNSVGSYVHLDFHPGNVFYEPKKTSLTIIDNDGIGDSLDVQSGGPIGIAAHDVIYFMHWIAIQGIMSQLSEEEISILQQSFLEEYTNNSKNEYIQDELSFMKVYIPAQYIIKLDNVLQTPNHPWLKSLGKETIQHLRGYLIQTLKTVKVSGYPGIGLIAWLV